MWLDSQPLRGITRFKTFGLRRDWLQLYLDHPTNWEDLGALGNQQVIAFKAWLRTLGVLDEKSRETGFGLRCRTCGLNDLRLWQELWVRAVFQFNGTAWYAYQGLGQRSTAELRRTLAEDAPTFSHYGISHSILEVVSMLAHTPIGDALGQGLVQGKNKRIVTRIGLPTPAPSALGLALELLFHREDVCHLKTDKSYLWPWTVFGCTQDVARRLMAEDTRFIWEANTVRLRSL